jgi:GT2 family glycosyltransferase
MSPARLSVLIPTFRRFEPLLDTIESLLAQREVEFEIVIVDQNPAWPDHLHIRKTKLAANMRVKWLTRDQPGVVAARHDAVAVATGDIFVFVDDDVLIPDQFFLARHLANYKALPDLDVVIGREVYREQPQPAIAPFPPQNNFTTSERLSGTPVSQAISFDRMRPFRCEVVSFCTCNSSVRREAFFRVGGFDEAFHGAAYGDDYDFAIRLARSGGKFVYDPQAWLIHLQAPSGGLRLSDKKTEISEEEKIYPSILFLLKHNDPAWKWYLRWGVIRRSVLLKVNVSQPWRQPRVWLGLWRAWRKARSAVLRGPSSRFGSEHNPLN